MCTGTIRHRGNFIYDINATGTLTVADRPSQRQVGNALPPP
jgi:hypothetical protein